MEAPPRKRGRPPKHPKVNDDSPTKKPTNSPSPARAPADVDMVEPVADSRSGQRGRKKSALDKLDNNNSKPGGGGSPSDRDADDVDSPVERPSSRRAKKSASVCHTASHEFERIAVWGFCLGERGVLNAAPGGLDLWSYGSVR